MKETIIKTNDIYKSFGSGAGKTEVLKGISLEVDEGNFVSIMGPSGCGKSTLLYIIGGLDNPDKGTVEVCGKKIAALSDKEKSIMRRREVGFVFQFYNLVANLTVEENILMPVIMDRKKIADYKDKLDYILNIVGMNAKKNAYPNELSGGQQQKVAIARALVMGPRVLLADEPTGNLDKKSGEEVMNLFREVNETMKVTILQVTHSDEMALYGNRTIRLLDGVIDTR